MPMTCARCGAQNPDGNVYCQNCGTPLAAPPPPPPVMPGPPPGPPPYAPPPPGVYGSPYYVPTGAATPMHRTRWTLILAGVVALVLVMGGCGTALAVIGSRGGASVSGSLGAADVPSPTPEVTPSPVASPAVLGSSTVSNDSFSVTLPQGWVVASKDTTDIQAEDPNSEGEVDISSASSSPAATAQDDKAQIENELKTKYPDTRACPNTKAVNSTLGGVKGISWSLCFTLTDGTHSVPAGASMFVGANPSGSVYYLVIVLTRQDELTNYLKVTAPVTASIHWKL